MENIRPNEDILDDIDFVTVEEAKKKRGKRSSILKRPKNSEDDILDDDLQTGRKSFGTKRRVSFAEKFQVMEMNTGNIYDISGKSKSPSNKNSAENEGSNSESRSEAPEEKCYLLPFSTKNINFASPTEINERGNEDSSSLLSIKHKIDSDNELQPERKKISAQNFPHHLNSDCVSTLPNDVLEFKNYLFNTTKDFTSCDMRKLNTKLTFNQNPDINSDSLQSYVQERFIEDESKFTTNKSNISNYDKIILGMDMPLQTENVLWEENRPGIKGPLKEFGSSNSSFPFLKKENLTNESPNVNLYPISLSDVPLVENKENLYVDKKNKSILVTNAKHLKLKDETLQISQDVKNPYGKLLVSNQRCFIISSETNLQDSKNCISESTKVQVSSPEDNSNSDKTCIFNHSMDLTCVSEMNVTSIYEHSVQEEVIFKEDSKLNEECRIGNLCRNDKLNKVVADTSQQGDLICNPEDLTLMQNSLDSKMQDVSVSESIKHTFQQNESEISKSCFGNQCNGNKTVFDSSHYMDLTCHPQDLTVMQGLPETSVENVSVSEPSLLTSKQNEGVTLKSYGNYCEGDKTVFNSSDYMDLTFNPKDLTVMQDSFDDSVKNVSVSESTKLTFQQNENVISKSSFYHQCKDDKTVFDASQYMDLTCHPQDLTDMQDIPETSVENVFVSELPFRTSKQNEDVTLENCYGNHSKGDKTVFDSSHCMDLTCKQDFKKVVSEEPEGTVRDVSESPKLIAQQIDKSINKTALDTYYMSVTCSPQNLRNIGPNLPESSSTDKENSDKNWKIAVDMLYCNKTQTSHVEEKVNEDKTCSLDLSLKSTFVPPDLELTGKLKHVIHGDCTAKEIISLHSNTSMANQTQNKQNFLVSNELEDNQEIKTKFDFSDCMEFTCSVQDLPENLPDSHKSRLNLAFSPNSTESLNECDEDFHKLLNAKQNNSLLIRKPTIEITNLDTCSKKKLDSIEMCTSASSNILKSQINEEILDTSSLKNQNMQKLKELFVISESPAFVEKNTSGSIEKFDIRSNLLVSNANENAMREPPSLLNSQIAEEMNSSFPIAQNLQKLGEYMFVNTDERKDHVLCRKADAHEGGNFDNHNPNLLISVVKRDNAYGKKLEKDTNKILTSEVYLLKEQADTEVDNFAVLSVENSQKPEKNVFVTESTRKPPFSSKDENKIDWGFNCHKMNSPVSSEVPNNVLIGSEAKKDDFPDCKENTTSDFKSEGDKYKNSPDPNIVYAIKQLKSINQPVANKNILKFPELFLSIKKQPIPRKSSFSCSSMQLSKAVREYMRLSSEFFDQELSFTSGFKHDTLFESKSAINKCDKNLPKSSENLCNSDLLAHNGIPSSSQVIRSASKIIEKKIFIHHGLSPKQIISAEVTSIPQTSKESYASSQSLSDLNSLRKSINFDNEITSNLPKMLVSPCAKENTSYFAKNDDISPDNSELFLENCSIDLVPNEDSLDSRVLKQNSRIDLESSKLNIPHEVSSQQLSDKLSVGNKEVFVQISQNEVEKENNKSEFLSNLDIDDELKSNSTFRHEARGNVKDSFFANSSRLSVRQDDDNCQISFAVLGKHTLNTDMDDDKNRKADSTKEKLDTELQKASKPETNKDSFKSVILGKENVYKLGECALADVGLIKSQSRTENIICGKSRNDSCFENLSRLSIRQDDRFCEKSFALEENQSRMEQTITEMVEEEKNNNIFTCGKKLETKVQNISKAKINEENCSSVFQEKGNLLESDKCGTGNMVMNKNQSLNEVESNVHEIPPGTSIDKSKKGDKSLEVMHSRCLSKPNQAMEVTKGNDNCLLNKESENSNAPAFSLNPLERKSSDEDDILFLKDNNPHALKTVSMEVDDNLGLNILSEKSAAEEQNRSKSKLSSQIEKVYQDSLVEEQNNCVMKEKLITEITIIEKHVVVNELKNDVYAPTPSKMFKAKDKGEIFNTSGTSKQNLYLLQGNAEKNTKLSAFKLNERPANNVDEVLEKNGNKESSVHSSYKLLKNEVNKASNQPSRIMSSSYSTKENHIKEITNTAQNKSTESSSVAVIPNASLFCERKNTDVQDNNQNSHRKRKQNSSTVSRDVTINDRLQELSANFNSLDCPSNLSKDNGKSIMFADDENLDRKECESKVTKTVENPASNKNGKRRKKNKVACSSNSCQSQKKCLSSETTEIQDMKDCSPALDAGETTNMVIENEYEKFHTLRAELREASKKEGCLWRLKELDDKIAVFKILPVSPFACYLMYVPLELNAETSSSAKISFEHLKPEPDPQDEMGFLLFKSYVAEIMPPSFSADEFVKTISKCVDYALLVKSFIKDLWRVVLRNKTSFDTSQEIPKLTVEAYHRNRFSIFSLTFPINFKSYPHEKIIPQIEHLECNVISNEIILNAIKEIEPGEYYFSNMVKAAISV